MNNCDINYYSNGCDDCSNLYNSNVLSGDKCNDCPNSSNHCVKQNCNIPLFFFGDTVSAVMGAFQSLRNCENNQCHDIYIAVEGSDITDQLDITETDFVPLNRSSILKYYNNEKLFYIRNDHRNVPSEIISNQNNLKVQDYKYPFGTMADFIAAPIIPRIGNFYEASVSKLSSSFIKKNTIKVNSNHVEKNVIQNISSRLGINIIDSFISTNKPGILNHTLPFIHRDSCKIERNLFLNIYNYVMSSPNVTLLTGVRNLNFKVSNVINNGRIGLRLYEINLISNNRDYQIPPSKLIFRTNPYTLLRVTNQSLPNLCLKVPTHYRAVISISNREIRNLKNLGDGTTTAGTFTVGDVFTNPNSHPHWLVSYHTNEHDYSPTNLNLSSTHNNYYSNSNMISSISNSTNSQCNGSNNNDGFTLLIVEAINKRNLRYASYNHEELAVEVNFNAKKIECAYFIAFKKIVETIIFAYTGQTICLDEKKKITENGYTYCLNQLTDTPSAVSYVDSINLLMKHFGSKLTPRLST